MGGTRTNPLWIPRDDCMLRCLHFKISAKWNNSRHYEAITLEQSRDCIHYLGFTESTIHSIYFGLHTDSCNIPNIFCFRKSFWPVPKSETCFLFSLWPMLSYSGTVIVISLWHLILVNNSYNNLIITLRLSLKKCYLEKNNLICIQFSSMPAKTNKW